jgi:8-oxo-dGTP pyrophosphatase MutT (NUDIX family)
MDLGFEEEDLALRIAAIRETLEECGLLLSDHHHGDRGVHAMRESLKSGQELAAIVRAYDLVFDFAALVPFARWCPPEGSTPHRFDTHFYLAVVGDSHGELSADGTETQRCVWHSAAEVLAEEEAGRARLIFPTRCNLERLAQFDRIENLVAHAHSTEVAMISPWVERRNGEDHLCIPEGLGYPVTSQPLTTAIRA